MELPGQVSYRPVDDQEVGDLCLNRITEDPPRCQQLLKFEHWFPPTRTSVALPPATTFQHTRSQRNWLYKTHPEAFLGNPDLRGLISEETKAQKTAQPHVHTGSVLAVGEIVDLRNTKSSRLATCPVVAVAAGEAGHMLQLSLINPEKWSWNDSAFASGAPQTQFKASWCNDGSPISKIDFATKLKRYDKLHWLIAQKETSTTIFEPEVRARPVAATTSVSPSNPAIADHIVLNPVVTLKLGVTGGESHSDFAVNLGSDDLAPQLAVIDRAGNWAVWQITRHPHGRRSRSKAVLMKKGSFAFPVPEPSDPSCLFETSKIAWTMTRTDRVDEWERDNSPSAQPDPLADGPQVTYPVDFDVSPPKYDGLLMCSHTQLQVIDIDGSIPPSLHDFSKRDGSDTLLDAQTFRGSSSHVLVLTTDRLYVLEFSMDGMAMSPNILASCRHFRNSAREMLKMAVTKLRSSHEEASSLVSIHSAQSFRLDLFWFVINHRDGTARFHGQVVHFPELQTGNVEGRQGIESFAAVPLHLAPSKENDRELAHEDANWLNDVQLYQFYALTRNLSLSTAVVAVTHGAQHNLPEPAKARTLWCTDERRAKFLGGKWLREAEQAFVVPDQVEEVKPLSISRVASRTGKDNTIQLRPYLTRLLQEINTGFLQDASGNSVKLSGAEYLKPIREAWKDREEGGDHVALRPLLGFSNLWKPLELSTLEDEVESGLRRWKPSQEVQFFECGHYGLNQGAMGLFEKLSTNWSSTLSAEALTTTQWRYMELALERMAAEVYLSEKGVFIAPQSALVAAAKSLPDEGIRSTAGDEVFPQALSSQATSIPPGTPPSAQATFEVTGSSQGSPEDEESDPEDPAVARLRMYLPSIKFTPAPKNGPSRVISLWPEQRGADPFAYLYRPPGQKPEMRTEAARRRREKEESRRRRRAEKRAQLGFRLESVGESSSQPYRPMIRRSSPPAPPSQDMKSSQPQAQSQGLAGLGWRGGIQTRSQTMGFTAGFGFSQTMSQPLPGEFGSRRSKPKKIRAGFR